MATAPTRFVKDTGLTARMTATMLVLGGLFVGLIAVLVAVLPGPWAFVAGFVGLGIAWWQWWNSDTLALKSMRAREVTAAEAPELHQMIAGLCAKAGMPMPKVAIAYTDLPNAFATGRSPSRAAVCVTTGILDKITMEELEGVLAHELSHVAHRDVLVMTVASSAGIIAGMLARGAQFGGLFGGGRDRERNTGLPVWLVILLVSMVTYFISFLATRLLSRYRELAADRSGAYLTGNPQALASALVKISGETRVRPKAELQAAAPMNAFFITPAIAGLDWSTITSTHPSLDQRIEQLNEVAHSLGQAPF